jgi:hypothetical protein
MPQKLQDGLKLRLLVDGVHQINQSEVSLEVDGKNQPLETLEGLAGKTPGAGMATITGTGIVPVGGPEFDYLAAVVEGSYHDLQIPYGTKSYIGSGWFDKANLGQSTGKGTEISFTWIGDFSKPR